MKQHPTQHQITQLSEQDQQKLYAWADEHGYYEEKEPFHEWFTIGRMIEFLDLQGRFLREKDKMFKTLDWVMENELCDALFEAVKETVQHYKM